MGARLPREFTLAMYRICWTDEDGNYFDDYAEATDAQHAVDRVRGWNDGAEIEIVEVAKVVKNYK